MRLTLRNVAHARSGDKGNTVNIVVIAYAPELYPCIADQITEDRIKEHGAGVIKGRVSRYEVPELGVLNFVCEESLGGGVSRSLCLDNYGKTLSAAFMNLSLDVPDELVRYAKGI